MNITEEKLRGLLSLKRYEKPPVGYIDSFLEEFRRRCSKEPADDNRLIPIPIPSGHRDSRSAPSRSEFGDVAGGD